MTARDRLFRAATAALLSAGDIVRPRRLSILIFHRVLPEPDTLFPGEMHARRFDRLMGEVARHFNVLTVGEAALRLDDGALPPRALAISFDDGYADNATVALPLLQRHGLRATFFVATGFLDGGRMFNDTVIETVRALRAPRIDLSALGLAACEAETVAQRRALIERLLPAVKYARLEEREAMLRDLARAAGEPALPRDLMMTSMQVQALHRAGMEIGGHTVRHPILRVLPDAEAEAEIEHGRRRLQDLTSAAVDVFAFPNGRPNRDYDARHVSIVRRLGFRAAVSTAPGTVGKVTDRFQWPRFTPWDEHTGPWMARLAAQRWRGAAAFA